MEYAVDDLPNHLRAAIAQRQIAAVRCARVEEELDAIRKSLDRGSRERVFEISESLEREDFLASWCGAGAAGDEPVAEKLLDAARAPLNLNPPAASTLERRWHLDSADGEALPAEAIEVARFLLADAAPSAIDSVKTALSRLRASGWSDAELLRKISRLWRRPILIVATHLTAPPVEMIAWLLHAVENAPAARLVVVIDEVAWERLRGLLDAHSLAMLEQAMSKPAQGRTPNPDAGSEVLRRAGSLAEGSGSSAYLRTGFGDAHSRGETAALRQSSSEKVAVEALLELQHRASQAVEKAKRAIAAQTGPSIPPPERDIARSLAEALLHAALNADGGFQFGDRSAEIDLFCASLAVAIEVDGYFHFQDTDAYRRDRAKDWLMQRHGFLVLRFLADDVTERLELIVERVAEAVALRQSRPG